jgi:phosphatidylglycerol lysyltransferase
MTDVTTSRGAPAILSRIPATLSLLGVVLIVGIASGGLWRPFIRDPLFEVVAYGLPAFSEGRWWTAITGTFFVERPIFYVIVILSFVGLGFVEYRRGWRRALGYFVGGQLFAVFASAAFLWLASMLPWAWAQTEARALDVGPSGGTMAGIAAAVGLLAAPWRVRLWFAVLGYSLVALFFWGSLMDLEHAFAVLLVLVIDRSLRIRRTTVREQRLIAFFAVLSILAVEVLTLLASTNGPFGETDATKGPWVRVTIDIVVALLLADGLRRGRRWAWVGTLALATVNIITGAVLLSLLVLTLVRKADLDAQVGDVNVALAQAAMWGLLVVFLVWVRGAFSAHRRMKIGLSPTPSVDDVKAALHSSGGGTLSWMTTWSENDYARTPRDGIVAFQRHSGVAIALADPLGPPASRPSSVDAFVHAAERAGLVPCFFGAGEQTKAAIPDGWRSMIVAVDTIVDLEGLAFTGKRWNDVRTSLNRAHRDEMTFRMTRLADEPWGVREQLRAISEQWVSDRGLPELGFTLGTLDEAADPEVRLALAVSPVGDVDGFLSWLPIYGEGGVIRGWTLDLMRRREGGFGMVMEYLIGSSARLFADEGAQLISLSGAPLAHDYPPGAGAIASLSERLSEMLEPIYGFRSLHRFKEKFQPRYEKLYLLFREESDLTRIGAGLTRAFMPDVTLRQVAGAGLELIRGGGR